MDPTSRGWKMPNLVVRDSEVNNNPVMLEETPNIEFVLEIDNPKPM